MRVSEWVALAYFVYLGALSWTRRTPFAAAARTTSAAAIVGVWLAARGTAPVPDLRDWLPGVYLLIGYWMSGAFYTAPMTDVEAWLTSVDRRLFDRLHVDRRVRAAPRLVLEGLELAYLWCYPLVPAGLLALLIAGRTDLADWYWTVVLAAELPCYGALPWIQTRPPRVIERDIAIARRTVIVRRLNLAILDRGSIKVNTVPSGHAAGALAVALALAAAAPLAGALFGLLALAIATASIVGRYHYAADSVSGLLFAIVVWTCVRWLWPM